jgi:hypothetical protein
MILDGSEYGAWTVGSLLMTIMSGGILAGGIKNNDPEMYVIGATILFLSIIAMFYFGVAGCMFEGPHKHCRIVSCTDGEGDTRYYVQARNMGIWVHAYRSNEFGYETFQGAEEELDRQTSRYAKSWSVKEIETSS